MGQGARLEIQFRSRKPNFTTNKSIPHICTGWFRLHIITNLRGTPQNYTGNEQTESVCPPSERNVSVFAPSDKTNAVLGLGWSHILDAIRSKSSLSETPIPMCRGRSQIETPNSESPCRKRVSDKAAKRLFEEQRDSRLYEWMRQS